MQGLEHCASLDVVPGAGVARDAIEKHAGGGGLVPQSPLAQVFSSMDESGLAVGRLRDGASLGAQYGERRRAGKDTCIRHDVRIRVETRQMSAGEQRGRFVTAFRSHGQWPDCAQVT